MTRALLALALAASASSAGAVDWSGTLGVTSDYVFRGISQSDEGPALQAGVTATWTSGAYVDAWASSVEFGPGDDASVELDLLVGWSGSPSEAWSLDVGVVRYAYPGESRWDYAELLASAEWRERVLLMAAWSNDALALGSAGAYVAAGYRFTLGKEWTLDVLAGRSLTEALPGDGYWHHEAKALRAWGDWELELSAHATPSSARRTFGRLGDARLVVGVLRSW